MNIGQVYGNCVNRNGVRLYAYRNDDRLCDDRLCGDRSGVHLCDYRSGVHLCDCRDDVRLCEVHNGEEEDERRHGVVARGEVAYNVVVHGHGSHAHVRIPACAVVNSVVCSVARIVDQRAILVLHGSFQCIALDRQESIQLKRQINFY